MILKSIEGNKVRLAHKKSNGKFKEVTVSTDKQGVAFIKRNIESITYDTTNEILRFRQNGTRRPLASVLANDVYKKDVYRVTFGDGNKFNLTRSNLV